MGDHSGGSGVGTYPPGGLPVRCPLWRRCPQPATRPACPAGCARCSPQPVWGGTGHHSEGAGGALPPPHPILHPQTQQAEHPQRGEAGERSRTPSWQGCSGGAQSLATSQCPGDSSGTQPWRPGTHPLQPWAQKAIAGGKKWHFQEGCPNLPSRKRAPGGEQSQGWGASGQGSALGSAPLPQPLKGKQTFFPPLCLFLG